MDVGEPVGSCDGETATNGNQEYRRGDGEVLVDLSNGGDDDYAENNDKTEYGVGVAECT